MAKKAYVVGSDNVFADLGHPRPAEALAKAELARKMYPDQERFGKEEQRRFEILDAHWDVPLNEVVLETPPGPR